VWSAIVREPLSGGPRPMYVSCIKSFKQIIPAPIVFFPYCVLHSIATLTVLQHLEQIVTVVKTTGRILFYVSLTVHFTIQSLKNQQNALHFHFNMY
jgi:hypothetical protein